MFWWQRSWPHEEGGEEPARRGGSDWGWTGDDKKGFLKFRSASILTAFVSAQTSVPFSTDVLYVRKFRRAFTIVRYSITGVTPPLSLIR